MTKNAIETIDALIIEQRIRWLEERPAIRSDFKSIAELLEDLRSEYRYHRDAKQRLEKSRNAISAMIEQCEIAMHESERFAQQVIEGEPENETIE